MNFTELMTIIGMPALLSTTIPLIIGRYYKKKDESNNLCERAKEIEDEVSYITNKHKKDKEEIHDYLDGMNETLTILKNAQQAVLRDRIIQIYNRYYNDKKYMPIYARESLEHMYEEYKKLGGNGVIEALMEKLRILPTDPTDENEENIEDIDIL